MTDDVLLDDIEDYWEMVERKQDRAATFMENPSRDGFAELIDKKHFWATRARGSTDQYLDKFVFAGEQTPEEVAATIQEALDTGVVEPLTELDGFGWATGTEILRALEPDRFAILNTRSKLGLEALGYSAPNKNTASQSQYEAFVEKVRDASEEFDLEMVVEDVTGTPIPEWATELEIADFAFSLHHDEKYDLTTLDGEISSTSVLEKIGRENAAYYWVNQRNQPEIENEYLKARVDDIWHHDLPKLTVGDIVFHNYDGTLVGISTVEESAETFSSEGQEYYRVEVDLRRFDDPVPVDEVLRDELGRERYRTDKYYPLDKNNDLNEAYLANLSRNAAAYILDQARLSESTGRRRYYWLNTGVDEWQQPGGEMFVVSTSKSGTKRDNQEGFKQASPGDEVLIYHMSPNKCVVGRGHVKRGLHEGYSEYRDERAEGITVVWDEAIDGPSWESIEADAEIKESTLVTSGNNYYLCSLSKAEFDRILELGERSFYTDHHNVLSVPESEITVSREGLYFTDNEWERIQSRVEKALANGNHVLLFGPPGTGKTKLARQVCEATVGADNYELVTASADWSTFDTVGGYQTTSQNTLEFEPGVVLDRFQNDSDGMPANEWLVIDELNRADIDKAFGSLFSALTGESVTLPFDGSDSDPIQILDASQGHAEVAPNRFYIPEDWRMLATMNTLDKTSLYEMSYAFMRRWAFVPIGIPDLPAREDGDGSALESLVADYVAVWAANGGVPEADQHYETVGRIWRAVNEQRAIGPAIVEDIYEHVAAASSTETADYVSPIIMYVFPQLEGLRRNELEQLIGALDEIVDDETGELWTVARDFFQIDLQPGGGE